MKRWMWLVLLAMFLVGCNSKSSAIGGSVFPSQVLFEGLERSEYEITGDVTGSGCTTFVGLWPIPICFRYADGWTSEVSSVNAGSKAARIALYRAHEKVPDADGLVAPRFVQTVDRGGIWYKRTCVRVKAKAYRIKTDAELHPDGADSSGSSGTSSYRAVIDDGESLCLKQCGHEYAWCAAECAEREGTGHSARSCLGICQNQQKACEKKCP